MEKSQHSAVYGSLRSGRKIRAYTPEQFVKEVADVLPLSTPQERKRLLEHARAWAVVSHNGEVPQELVQRIKNLETQYASAR